MIQNLEYENAMLSSEEMRVSSLLDTVRSLSNLSVLSLPDCIDVATNQTIAADLNACLKVYNTRFAVVISFIVFEDFRGTILSSCRPMSRPIPLWCSFIIYIN